MYFVDFETCSEVDLTDRGADRYVTHDTTEMLCVTIHRLDEDTGTWRGLSFQNPDKPSFTTPFHPDDLPASWRDEIASGAKLWAFNASFDWRVWNEVMATDYDWPLTDIKQWNCMATLARTCGLPGNLDGCAQALGLGRKDHEGTRLIKACCIPPYSTDSDDYRALMKYCRKDTRLLTEIYDKLKFDDCQITGAQALWRENEIVNLTGVEVDITMALEAVRYDTAERDELNAELNRLTNGRITKLTQRKRIAEYIFENSSSAMQQLLYRGRDAKGNPRLSLDEATRREWLEAAATLSNPPEPALTIVEMLDEAGATSVSKFKSMVLMADNDDNRVRGAFVPYGAQSTGRYSSRGLQLHNFRRDCEKLPRDVSVRSLLKEWQEKDKLLKSLPRLLRSALVPKHGNVFVVGDWVSVEAMALPWLARDDATKPLLAMFEAGEDVYIADAADMGVDDRQVGKVARLSLGFGGSNGAFHKMARNFGLKFSDADVTRWVRRWREANAWAPRFWRACEHAAIKAHLADDLEETFYAGEVEYYTNSGGYLCAQLPGMMGSLLPIHYAQPRFQHSELSAIKAAVKPKKDATEWPRVTLWNGLLAENNTQGFCARLLMELQSDLLTCLDLKRCSARLVMSTHDEVVLECPREHAECVRGVLHEHMVTNRRASYPGLPLAADVKVMERYGK